MSRILAISDIHGHTPGVQKLLETARYDPGSDELFLLGDYIDYDPKTWSAIDYIRQLTVDGAQAISGNMECWLYSQKNAALPNASRMDFIGSLPYYRIHSNFLFVHAGLRPGVRLENQLPADMTEIREDFWMTPNPFPLQVIFGHTPTHRIGATPGSIWAGPGMTGIDTGAKHGLRLSLLDLTHRGIFSCSTDPKNLYSDLRFTPWPGNP